MDQRGLAFTFLSVIIGVIAAVAGWWAMFIAPSILDAAASSLVDPQIPVSPRLVTVAVVLATGAVALLFRLAALVMGAFAVLAVAYSLLVFMDLAPAIASLDGITIEGSDPALETRYAIVIGGASLPHLTLGGLWIGVASWWLATGGNRPRADGRVALWVVLGIGLAVVGWWLLPVVTRAMVIMFSQGREAFSPLPALLCVALAGLLVWLALRWPGVALGAAAAALAFAVYSLVANAPDPELIPGGAAQWTIGVDDLLASIRSTAFRVSTIELTAAWSLIAIGHLLAIRPMLGRPSVTEPATTG